MTCFALLWGGVWAGIRSTQAEQAPAATDVTSSEKTSSGDSSKESATPTSTPEDAAQADMLLQEARTSLLNRQSLQADMRQQIHVGERQLKAEGTYLSGAFPKLRLEYKIRVGSMQGSLTEICDGTILHTQKAIGLVGAKDPEWMMTRRDVQKILAATENSKNLAVASLGAEIGIGGLPAILASIDRCMVGKRVTAEEFEGQTCRVYHGAWDPVLLQNYYARLEADSKEVRASLMPFFPDTVQVFFTSDTLLPVKIVYFKNEQDQAGKISGVRALMVLEFRNLKLDQPVPPTAFQFVLPSGREEMDTTNDFLTLIQASSAVTHGVPQAVPQK